MEDSRMHKVTFIKKDDTERTLVGTINVDILNEVDKTDITTIGFKAEMDEHNAVANASKMIDNKDVDAVCLNILKDSSSFGTDTNTIDFILPDRIESIPCGDKLTISFDILEHAKSL